MRVLMTGGGTGGHVYPALAIADTIRQNDSDAEIAFVGTPRGIENKLVPKEGYHLYHVDIQGLRRSLSLMNIRTAYLTLTSPSKAKKIINEFRPDAVIGTGGYVCWPIIKAASDMGIVTALHESNAVPGAAVKMLSPAVDRIYLNFEETGKGIKYKDKLMHVGCPLRGELSSYDREAARRCLEIPDKYKYFVLSFGGSLGAEKVNDAVLELMRRVTSKRGDIYHVHAAGSIEIAEATRQFRESGLDKCENLKLVEYIYDMPLQMSAADIIISRAGAITVSELALAGKCAIFIPSPNVTNNQQFKNANVLATGGAAVLIPETAECPDKLCGEVTRLLSADGAASRREMAEKIKTFAVSDCNKLIYNDIVKLVSEKSAGKK